MREIIRKYRAEYTATRRSQRREVAERVLDEILATGARFLRRIETDTGRELWQEVDRSLAHEKVSHALREKKYSGANTDDEESSLTTRNPLERHQSHSPRLSSTQLVQQTTSTVPQEVQHPYTSSLHPAAQSSAARGPSLPTQQSGAAARSLLPFQGVSDTFHNDVANTRLEGLYQSNRQQYQQRSGTSPFPYLVQHNYNMPSVAAGLALESLIHQHTTDIASASQNLIADALGSHYYHQVGGLLGTMSSGSLLAGRSTPRSSGGFPTAAAALVQQFPQAALSPAVLAFLLLTNNNNNAPLPPMVVQAIQQELAPQQVQLVGFNDDMQSAGTDLLASQENNMILPRSASEGPPEAGSRIAFLAPDDLGVHRSSNPEEGANARELSNPFPSSLRDSSNLSSLSTGEAASPKNDNESSKQNINEKKH